MAQAAKSGSVALTFGAPSNLMTNLLRSAAFDKG